MNKLTMEKVGDKDLRVTRRFNAAPSAVYDAHVDEAKIKRWMLGPEGWTMPHCSVDAREGGAFSYTWEDSASGEGFTISGTFQTLDPPNQIVHEETMEMGGESFSPSTVTTAFAADGDGTLMTMTISYASAEDREGAIAADMEAGMAVSYDNLEQMVSGA